MKKIRVNHSGIVELQSFNNYPAGQLTVAEVGKHIPFKIKKIYFINNVLKNDSSRGNHAHKKLDQYMFCLNGSCRIKLDDGKNKQKITLNNSKYAIRLGPLLWHSMNNFSKDCVLLVVANDYHKESDYIRDYNEFIKYIKNK